MSTGECPAGTGALGTVPAGAATPGHSWLADDGWHVELRGLEPPQPLTLVLRLLTQGIDGQMLEALTLHHDRDPVLLYDELDRLGWTAIALPGTDGEVCLRLVGPQAQTRP